MRDEIKQVDIDKIYRETPLEKIPWNLETPPEAMVELVRSGKIKPCKTVDLGCGAHTFGFLMAASGVGAFTSALLRSLYGECSPLAPPLSSLLLTTLAGCQLIRKFA
jgi:hypothetical protein